MGYSVFGIGVSGLNAAQIGLTTTGHNISNATTPGFHRQQAIQMTNIPQFTGAGYTGQGVKIDTIKRFYGEFLDKQVSDTQAKYSHFESYNSQAKQIDNLLSDVNSGLSPALQDFFTAVNDVASTPASAPSRQTMLGGAEAMITRIQGLSARLTEMRDGINTQVRASVELINSYSSRIADLNLQISIGAASGQPPNDLLDQREQLVADLNKEVKATIIKQDDGSTNVFIGTGQPLVLGSQAMTLAATPSTFDPERLEVGLDLGSTSVVLDSSLLKGGNLSGLLAYRSETLDMAQNSLGRVAMGLAQTFNDQHRLGQDLDGNPGGDFFTAPVPKPAISKQGNALGLSATVTVNDVNKLTVEDYNLQWDATAAAWKLTTVSTGAAVAMTGTGTALDPFEADGLSVVVAGVPNDGNGFQLQPTRDGARDIALAITNTEKIAVAAPIRTAATLANNTGTGVISAGTVNSYNDKVTITVGAGPVYSVVDNATGATLASNVAGAPGVVSFNGWSATIAGAVPGDVFTVDNMNTSAVGTGTISLVAPMAPNAQLRMPDPNLRNSVTINFTSATTFDVTDAVNGVLAVGVNYAAGGAISYNGWTVQIAGIPATNDTFTVGPNTNGVNDNRNGLLLAGLQTKNTLANGKASYQGTYSQMVSMVANKTNEADVNSKAQQNLLDQATQAQQALSGVNLDEEAANLMRYQQAYQASGKMIQIAGTLFDTLLSLR